MAGFLPRREPELVTWIGTFEGLITAAPTTYGLTAPQAADYALAAAAFIASFNIASADATRSPMNIIIKDDAKRVVVAKSRELAGIIQKFPGTTDGMRSALGLTVPAARTPIPPPPETPNLDIVERLGTKVRIRLHDGSGTRRGKPAGVQGARVYSYIGATAPVDTNDWHFEGQVTRTMFDVVFPLDTAPGAVVYLTAQWYNPRGQTGVACEPVRTNIAGGAMPLAA